MIALDARQELYRRGIIGDWFLRPEQRKFKAAIDDADTALVVANVSRRWGKTTTSVVYCIEQALRNKQRIRFSTAFRADLVEFIIPTFETVLVDCPDELKPIFEATRNVYKFPNGSEIKLVGIDKSPNSLRGNAINIIVIDEAGFVAQLRRVYENVIVPATAKQKNIKLILISTPPESPDHFFVTLADRARDRSNGYYLCLTIDDISDMAPAERARLIDEVGGINSTTAQREFYCKFLVDQERVIASAYSPQAHKRLYTPSGAHGWYLMGSTRGLNDFVVFAEMGWDPVSQKMVVASDMIFDSATPVPDIVSQVRGRYPDHKLLMRTSLDILANYNTQGINAGIVPADTFDADLQLLNTAFHNNIVQIDPTATVTVRTLEAGMVNKKKTDYERSEITGFGGAAQCLVAGLRFIDRSIDLRPKPSKFDVYEYARNKNHPLLKLGHNYGK